MDSGRETSVVPCGIDCAGCNLFRAPTDENAAQSLVAWFRQQGWLKDGEGARAVMGRGPYCHGCRGDRSVQWSGDCKIRKCCTDERQLQSCSACPDFPCAALNAWAQNGAHHAKALERLRSMRSVRGA
jgi:hypothetical protein